MNRFKTATAALLVASFIGLQPVAALADDGQRRYGYEDGDFPVTERIARETVTLPLHAAMTAADVDRVCAAMVAALARSRS